jgi:hypothetical protein
MLCNEYAHCDRLIIIIDLIAHCTQLWDVSQNDCENRIVWKGMHVIRHDLTSLEFSFTKMKSGRSIVEHSTRSCVTNFSIGDSFSY